MGTYNIYVVHLSALASLRIRSRVVWNEHWTTYFYITLEAYGVLYLEQQVPELLLSKIFFFVPIWKLMCSNNKGCNA